MVKIIKFFAYTVFLALSLIILIPKANIYYFAEKNLQNFDVVNSKEILTDNLFSLSIDNSQVSMKGIEALRIDHVDLMFLAVYNSIEFTNIKLSSLAKNFIPPKIQSIIIKHSIFSPLTVESSILGDFGEATAEFSIIDRKLRVLLKPSRAMLKSHRSTLRYFKKDKKGEYVYARKF